MMPAPAHPADPAERCPTCGSSDPATKCRVGAVYDPYYQWCPDLFHDPAEQRCPTCGSDDRAKRFDIGDHGEGEEYDPVFCPNPWHDAEQPVERPADEVQADSGEGEAESGGRWTIYVCPDCGGSSFSMYPECGQNHRNSPAERIEVVPADSLAAERERADRAEKKENAWRERQLREAAEARADSLQAELAEELDESSRVVRDKAALVEALKQFECPECEGTGKVYDEDTFPRRAKCPECGGTKLHPIAQAAFDATGVERV